MKINSFMTTFSTVIAANQAITRYTRDGLGKLLQLESPDTGIQIHYYDRAGQLSRTHNPAQPDQDIRYHYDQLGRVTRVTRRHSQIDYRYDQKAYKGTRRPIRGQIY